MSLLKKLNQNYKLLYNKYKRVSIHRKAYLLSDSKGIVLKDLIPSHLNLEVVAQKGANAENEELILKMSAW